MVSIEEDGDRWTNNYGEVVYMHVEVGEDEEELWSYEDDTDHSEEEAAYDELAESQPPVGVTADNEDVLELVSDGPMSCKEAADEGIPSEDANDEEVLHTEAGDTAAECHTTVADSKFMMLHNEVAVTTVTTGADGACIKDNAAADIEYLNGRNVVHSCKPIVHHVDLRTSIPNPEYTADCITFQARREPGGALENFRIINPSLPPGGTPQLSTPIVHLQICQEGLYGRPGSPDNNALGVPRLQRHLSGCNTFHNDCRNVTDSVENHHLASCSHSRGDVTQAEEAGRASTGCQSGDHGSYPLSVHKEPRSGLGLRMLSLVRYCLRKEFNVPPRKRRKLWQKSTFCPPADGEQGNADIQESVTTGASDQLGKCTVGAHGQQPKSPEKIIKNPPDRKSDNRLPNECAPNATVPHEALEHEPSHDVPDIMADSTKKCACCHLRFCPRKTY